MPRPNDRLGGVMGDQDSRNIFDPNVGFGPMGSPFNGHPMGMAMGNPFLAAAQSTPFMNNPNPFWTPPMGMPSIPPLIPKQTNINSGNRNRRDRDRDRRDNKGGSGGGRRTRKR